MGQADLREPGPDPGALSPFEHGQALLSTSGPLGTWPLIAVTALYIVGGELGLAAASAHASATALWPATGIALAALLLLCPRAWPAVFAGAFLVNVTATGAVVMSLGIALGCTLEGLVGAALVRRFASGARVFERAPDIYTFAGLAGLLGSSVGATIGALSLASAGYATWQRWPSVWRTWWLADAAGALVVTPLLVLWCTTPISRPSRARLVEIVALAGTVTLVGLFVFAGIPGAVNNQSLAFLCLPPLVWAAFRFGAREAATAVAVASWLAIWGTARGLGPFATAGPQTSLLALQVFMAVMAMGVPLAVVVADRRRAEAETADLAAIVRSSDDAIVGTTLGGVITSWNPAAERLYGHAAAEVIGQSMTIVMSPGPANAGAVVLSGTGERVRHHETVRIRKDGTPVDVAVTVSPILDPGGAVIGVSEITRDITTRKALDAMAHERDTLRTVAGLAMAAAHEINNPLAVVLAQTELLAREARTPRQRRQLELSLAAIERIRAILIRMGHITRLEHAAPSPNLPDMLDLGRSSDPDDRVVSPRHARGW
jgi:PAS domain S-box-containing protein